MLFSYNRFHHAVFMNYANEYTGKIYKKYDNIESYFKLKETNDSLVKANERLYNKLKQDFEVPDSINKLVLDTIRVDSATNYRKFLYMQAKVVGNSANFENNYIEISRGSLQGVEKDEGVIDATGAVVGHVVDLSDNYAVVMSLLHKQNNVSARLKKTGEPGSVVWDGENAKRVTLKDIPKGVKVTVGDSVITSGYTKRFPYGLLIGTVAEIENDTRTNNYIIKLKTAADFYNVQYVYVVKNLKTEELKEIMKRVKKVNE
jgi:rod shape-determining protein MreC